MKRQERDEVLHGLRDISLQNIKSILKNKQFVLCIERLNTRSIFPQETTLFKGYWFVMSWNFHYKSETISSFNPLKMNFWGILVPDFCFHIVWVSIRSIFLAENFSGKVLAENSRAEFSVQVCLIKMSLHTNKCSNCPETWKRYSLGFPLRHPTIFHGPVLPQAPVEMESWYFIVTPRKSQFRVP